MSAWVAVVASMAWLAISTALTAGWLRSLTLWVAGLIFVWVMQEVSRRHMKEAAVAGQEVSVDQQISEGGRRDVPAQPEAVGLSDDGIRRDQISESVPLPSMTSDAHAETAANQPDLPESMAAEAAYVSAKRGVAGVLTASEAGSILRIPESELVAAMQNGQFPGNQIGGRWRCTASAMDSWLQGTWPPPIAMRDE